MLVHTGSSEFADLLLAWDDLDEDWRDEVGETELQPELALSYYIVTMLSSFLSIILATNSSG